MALSSYITQTQRLLQNPPGNTALYSTADLTSYINQARSQIAGEEACVRVLGTLAMAGGVNKYAFTAISLGGASGVQGVLRAQQIALTVSGGFRYVDSWAWPWFFRYYLSQVNRTPAAPQNWSQYAQGVLGNLYFDPAPDQIYSLSLDTVCYPNALVNDADAEAIPYPWTDAIPFYAAYFAYMSAQRQQDADVMYKRYEDFASRARKISTPTVLPQNFEQAGSVPISGNAGAR